MYAGGWPFPDGIEHVQLYSAGVKLITGFRIEMIALVSGYVFAYQSVKLNKKYDFRIFLKKKFNRLVIPGLIFSLVYYFCFQFNKPALGSFRWFVELSSGFGHLWFLPMLFWCFLAIWVIDRYSFPSKWLFPILAILSVVKFPDLPLGFSKVFHFAFYCYLGYLMQLYKNELLERYAHVKYIVVLWMSYLLLVWCSAWLADFEGYTILKNILSLLVACNGIFAMYFLVCKCIGKADFVLKDWVIGASSVCYGVYVYHQFILWCLYYHTPVPQMLGTYILPWCGLGIALPLSILLTKLSLRTKIGRFLIG